MPPRSRVIGMVPSPTKIGSTVSVIHSLCASLFCTFFWQLSDTQYKMNYLIGAGDSGISFGVNVCQHREVKCVLWLLDQYCGAYI